MALSGCGSSGGDVCQRADSKLDTCFEALDEQSRVFLPVPLDTNAWQDGCQTAFDRCAARCVVAASCAGIQRGLSSTDPANVEPAFLACLDACI